MLPPHHIEGEVLTVTAGTFMPEYAPALSVAHVASQGHAEANSGPHAAHRFPTNTYQPYLPL